MADKLLRVQKIDSTNIGDHAFLTPDDDCYYVFEKTAHRDYSFSLANSLISNIKKKPSDRGKRGFEYKARDMERCSIWLRKLISTEWLQQGTMVPIPPSKAKDHPDYDDRMLRICKDIGTSAVPVDVRELVIQTKSFDADHTKKPGEARITVAQLLEAYQINEDVAAPTPTAIAIVDDMLTAGKHYRAMHTVLRARFPDVPLFGLFIARRVTLPEDAAGDFSPVD